MPFAQLDDQRICFEDTGGNGLPVILSDGFLMDRQMFARQVAVLSPEFRVITWDERGFGQTASDGRPSTYWDSARDCLALLDIAASSSPSRRRAPAGSPSGRR